MPICVVVLEESQEANDLAIKASNLAIESIRIKLVKPSDNKGSTHEQTDNNVQLDSNSFPSVGIDTVKLLNPKLSQKIRQKTMAFWLMPFGFITGLAFTKMTGLHTFSGFGIDPIAEPLVGSLLGMGSGWLGSYVASGSVNPETNDDIKSLRKLNDEGLWLLIIKTPLETELPWALIKSSTHRKIIRLNEL
tara:strand:+ start:649 stop:1221 length:573 start_codon:yes stop_codon:yes gene_type:complete